MVIKQHRIILNLYQKTIAVFILVILFGAILLALPFSSQTGKSCGFLTALFTSTSAVCVTGLSKVDIWTHFTLFGQIVLLLLLQIGGLGFMSIITVFFHLFNRREGIQSLSLSAESLRTDNFQNLKRIQMRLLIGSLCFESVGALILFFCFLPSMGFLKAAWFGIFHAISAFCNAGFDLMGAISPGAGMICFQNHSIVLLTLSALIVIGGIGFLVWDDIASSGHPRKWSVYTQIVISVSAFLILFGAGSFFFMEFHNPETIGNMNLGHQIVNSIFQAVTPRTAGFASIDQSSLSDSSIALTSLLMIVGGSAGSTAGGIKTATFLIIFMTILSNLQGKKNVTIFHRTVSHEQLQYAFAISGGFVLLSITGGFLIAFSSDIPFAHAFFESISAISTVGLSLGVTASLSPVSSLIVILLMYTGRVGLLTLTLGFFKAREDLSIKYPSAKLIIG